MPNLGDVVSELGTYMQMPVAPLGLDFLGESCKAPRQVPQKLP